MPVSLHFVLPSAPLISLLVHAGGHIGGGWGSVDVEGAGSAAQDGQQSFQGRGSQEPRPGSSASAAQQAVSAGVCASGPDTLILH